jgi:hypothetical protein
LVYPVRDEIKRIIATRTRVWKIDGNFSAASVCSEAPAGSVCMLILNEEGFWVDIPRIAEGESRVGYHSILDPLVAFHRAANVSDDRQGILVGILSDDEEKHSILLTEPFLREYTAEFFGVRSAPAVIAEELGTGSDTKHKELGLVAQGRLSTRWADSHLFLQSFRIAQARWQYPGKPSFIARRPIPMSRSTGSLPFAEQTSSLVSFKSKKHICIYNVYMYV